jgi:2-oxoglutarate dehydrogenase E1 component
MKGREEMLKSGKNMDWGTAEALAFGTLLAEGYNVRLSGQDCERGTFSHRHCVVHDQTAGRKHMFLDSVNELNENAGTFHVANSFLSEYGVMGFELGYSMESPDNLVLWEAQFGDFVNGAQIIIDQYLASMESKWLRQTGLVLLLPHGYQGMGPEHSSARIERFLQLTDEDPDTNVFANMDNVTPEDRQLQLSQCNWQVVNPTTPAQYFHALRRQIHRQFRKPLVVASTKALLRHKVAVSNMEDLAEGTKFERILGEIEEDKLVDPSKMRRVVMCSGKIYYELLEKRQKENIDDVAIIRLEQLSPFPFDHVNECVSKYPNAELVWAQEEPKNQGAWTYVKHRLPAAIRDENRVCGYAGRKTMASTAEGYIDAHEREQTRITESALGL